MNPQSQLEHIAQTKSVLHTANVDEKLRLIESECHRLLMTSTPRKMSALDVIEPARDVSVVARRQIPARVGLQSAEGQARLLHDLANIELQAMELGVRTLYEFASAPPEFREGIATIVLEEAKHLSLCLRGVRDLGFEWGAWPVHNTLWTSTHEDDSLLDRILIVNCYLEASGLDAGELLLRRLSGVTNHLAREIVAIIGDEEIGHVRYGLKWYRALCTAEGLSSGDDFSKRLSRLFDRVPARAVPVNTETREKAGFTKDEIEFVQNFTQLKLESVRVATKFDLPSSSLERNGEHA